MKYPGALLFAFFILNFPFRPHQPSRVTIEHAVTHAERRVTSAHYDVSAKSLATCSASRPPFGSTPTETILTLRTAGINDT